MRRGNIQNFTHVHNGFEKQIENILILYNDSLLIITGNFSDAI
jgi:hypothetical protein